MVIDKVKPYWTEEDKAKEEAISLEWAKFMESINPEHQLDYILKDEEYNAYREIERKRRELESEIEARYINSFSKNPKGVYKDIEEIVEAIEREDYLQVRQEDLRKLIALEKELHPDNLKDSVDHALKELRELTEENYTNCFWYIMRELKPQFNALALYELDSSKGADIVKARVALWYEAPENEEEQGFNLQRFAEDNPILSFTRPKNHLQNLTKAGTKIFDSRIPITALQQVAFDVSPVKGRQATTYSVYVDMTAPELKGTENITEFDESIFNSVISVATANTHGFFTPKQLATHLLYGDNPNNSNPSPQRVGAVTKSIEKQRHIDITIDWTEHAQLNKKIPEGATFKVKGYMLPVKEYTATVNGQRLHGYQLIDTPPLYQYAKQVGQLGTHPAKMLNVPVNLNEQKIVIRDFLLKEIGHMNNSPRWNRTITLERILETAGEDLTTINKTKRKRLIETIRDMLDYWKREALIKGYKENAKGVGGAIQSFTIQTL